MNKDTKFKRGDWVRIVRGFESGATGQVTLHHEFSDGHRYGVDGVSPWIKEGDMEPAKKPWWVLW